MNRHERRKAAAQARRGKATDVQSGYVMHGVPEHVKNSAGFKRAQEWGKQHPDEMPPEYFEQIRKAAIAMNRWVNSQPTPPDLRWIEQKNDGVLVAADLSLAFGYIADSPDALRLLQHVDDELGHQLTLNQALWALRLNRAIRMPDGSWYGTEKVRESRGSAIVDRIATDLRGKTHRAPPSTCASCGACMDAFTVAGERMPEEGDISFCLYCAAVNMFRADLTLEPITDETGPARCGEQWPDIVEARELLRARIAEMALRQGGKREPAEA